MNKTVYTLVKKIPGFTYPLKTEFHVLNNEVYVNTKDKIYSRLNREKDFDDFDFNPFVNTGFMKKSVVDLDYDYHVGELVVYNKYGKSYVEDSFSIVNTKAKNCICKVISEPVLCGVNEARIVISNVFTGEKYNVKIKEIYAKTTKYWFLDSHGKIQMTYFWFKPEDDKYRIATGNVFHSYSEADNHIGELKELDLITEYKNYVEKWIG